MKKFISFFMFAFLALFSLNAISANQDSQGSAAQGKSSRQHVDLYFFWSKDCPHCVQAHPFIDKLKADRPWLRVHAYEISGSPKNGQLFEKMARDHGKETSFVPTFFVGDKMIVGYTSAETTGEEIRSAVDASHQ